MQYYYQSPDGKEMGPITLEELQCAGITTNTLVWREGMANWQRAGDLSELSSLFRMNAQSGEPSLPCPPTNLVWAILATIFCCLPAGIVSIVYASKVESEYRNGRYLYAKEYSRKALIWAIVSLGIGLLVSWPIIILLLIGQFAFFMFPFV